MVDRVRRARNTHADRRRARTTGDARHRDRGHRLPLSRRAGRGSAAFWQLLEHGVDAVGEVPPDRWPIDELFDPRPGTPGKVYTRWGGFLGGVDRFDARFFGLSGYEAGRW
jgi:beta-ketoacyl synthase-like protein